MHSPLCDENGNCGEIFANACFLCCIRGAGWEFLGPFVFLDIDTVQWPFGCFGNLIFV